MSATICPVLNVPSASNLSSFGNHGFAPTFAVVSFNTSKSTTFVHQLCCHYPGLQSQLYALLILYTFPMIPCKYTKLQLLSIGYSIQPRPLSHAHNPHIQLCPGYLYLHNLKALQIPHVWNWTPSSPVLISHSINDINTYSVSQARNW